MHYIIHAVPLQNVNVFIVVFYLNVKWWVHFLAAFEITEEEGTPLKCLIFLQAFSMHILTKLCRHKMQNAFTFMEQEQQQSNKDNKLAL